MLKVTFHTMYGHTQLSFLGVLTNKALHVLPIICLCLLTDHNIK